LQLLFGDGQYCLSFAGSDTKKIPGKFHYNLVLGGQHFCQPLQIKDIFQIIASASTAGLPALRKHFRKGNTLFKRLVT